MFIGRNLDGSIYGSWTCAQPKDADHLRLEELPDTHPDVVLFLTRVMPLVPSKVDVLEASFTSLDDRLKIVEGKR